MSSPSPCVGFARTPPVFLGDGDVVEAEIDEIGTLRTPSRPREPTRPTAPTGG